MKSYKSRNAFRIVAMILLALSTLYYGNSYIEWEISKKYEIDEARILKGLNQNIDKTLGYDKMNELTFKYKELWIKSESKHSLIMAVLSLIGLIWIFIFTSSRKSENSLVEQSI